MLIDESSTGPGVSRSAHRTRTWKRRDSRAVVEVSLLVSASETVIAPALRARKTITTEAPTFASDSWCKTLSLIGRATRQPRPPLRCGTATATSSPRWAAIEATGPGGSGPIGAESASATAAPRLIAMTDRVAIARFIWFVSFVRLSTSTVDQCAPTAQGRGVPWGHRMSSPLHEPLHEAQRALGYLAPPAVDCECVAASLELEKLGDVVVPALLLVSGFREDRRHGVVEFSRHDQHRSALRVLRVDFGFGPGVEVGRRGLEQRPPSPRHREVVVELLRFVLRHRVREPKAEL